MAKKIMSKKEMLKEQERIKKEKKLVSEEYKPEDIVKNFIYITIGVVLFLAVCYFGINLIKGKISFDKDEIEVDDKITNGVICGTLFTMNEPEYYVLAYNHSGTDKNIYSQLASNYQGPDKVYNMDLESGFNKTCVGEKLVIDNDVNKLKLTSPVLLKIVNRRIEKSYSTRDEIIKALAQN